MESIGDDTWDVVICGTGLQQSLLALALSRSKRRILHLDPNDYYGGNEAALSLQEAESWTEARKGPDTPHRPVAEAESADLAKSPVRHSSESRLMNEQKTDTNDYLEPQKLLQEDDKTMQGNPTTSDASIFKHADVWRHPEAEARGLSFPRAYSLALAPQIIHTRSRLLAQLVSSRAYRQVEFHAVGSFFVYEADSDSSSSSSAKLTRIPSSREDVFSARSIPARSKRALMKFLKFVVGYDSGENAQMWRERGDEALAAFLETEFKLDDSLRRYVLALTLTLDGRITVKDGLAAINRHIISMGLFGPGFCAVYPKWGGLSEIAQVACRAQAVGGGIYMLDTRAETNQPANADEISLKLSSGISVRTNTLVVSGPAPSADESSNIARLIAIVSSPLRSLFEVVVEGAPTPAVAVVAFPAGSLSDGSGSGVDSPIYATVHSADTGECPAGQCVVYLTTIAGPQSQKRLDSALEALLAVPSASSPSGGSGPICLYKLRYEQSATEREASRADEPSTGKAKRFTLPPLPPSLSFDDATLDAVEDVWILVARDDEGVEEEEEYMVFEDREGMGDDNDDDVCD